MGCFIFFLALTCLSGPLYAKGLTGDVADKAQNDVIKNNQPPSETPSGTKSAEPGNAAKPETPSKPETPTEPAKPSDSLNNGKPPDEPPSGTKPADPANSAENPAKPAEPGDKGTPDADKNVADKSKPDNADKGAQDNKDLKDKTDNGDKTKPEDSDKNQKDKDSKDAKEKKDKTDKDSKDKKDKPGKGGKSGGGHGGGLSLPSGIPTPQSGAASLLPAAGGVAGGIISGIFSGGKKDSEKEAKKEAPKPTAQKAVISTETAKEAVISSETVKAAAPVQASTPAVAAEPLYSEGKGPKIAVMDFDGESGAEFAELLAEALKADLKVYSRKELAGKSYSLKAGGMSLAKKVASEIAVDYVVTGKVSRKTGTLSVISVFLRNGKTGDIKLTDYPRLKSPADLKTAAESAARKIKEKI